MKLDVDTIKRDYEHSKGMRELKKWAFAIGTAGLGALYLWATTSVIQEGEIGLRKNSRGEMILLPPGRHSNFPWESYPVEPQSLAKKVINLEPYKIITVETGYVAKTINHGKLEILTEGQHLLVEAAHTFDSFVPVKQETKELHKVTAYTNDNVGLSLQADVRYQIEDPELAIRQIEDIEKWITETAVISIGQIVSHHNLAEIAPATTNVGGREQHEGMGLSQVINELTNRITEQFIRLGIKLLNIGITSWSINDAALAHELAQGAVIQSQTQSKMISAERESRIKQISAEAEAKATVTHADSVSQANVILARGEAETIKLRGEAIKMIADQFKDNPAAQAIYERSQQTELVQHAKNPNLFFTQQLAGGQQVNATNGCSLIMAAPQQTL